MKPNPLAHLLVVALLALLACFARPSAAQTILTIGTPVAGSIATSANGAWYQVTMSGTAPLFAHMKMSVPWDAGLAVYAGSETGTPVAQSETSSDMMLEVNAPLAGIYYVEVYATDDNNLPGAYTLTVTNSLPTLTIGTGQAGTIPTYCNADWYQVTASGTAPLFVHLKMPAPWSGGVAVYAGTLNSTPVAQSPDWNVYDQLLEIDTPVAGVYYVEVYDSVPSSYYWYYSDGYIADLPGAYTLTVTNSLPALTIGTGQADTIPTYCDADWYQVTVPGTDPFFVHLTMPGSWYADVNVYAGTLNSTPVATSSDDTDQMLEIDNPVAGVIYVEVDGFGDYGLPGAYTLSVTTSLTAPTVDFSGTPDSPVAAGAPVTLVATYSGGGDVEYQFQATETPAGGAPTTTVLQDWTLDANSYTWIPTDTGAYVLQVSARQQGTTDTTATSLMTYTVIPPLTAVALAPSPPSPRITGTAITLTATPTGGANVEYQFCVDGTPINTVKDWSNTLEWTPIDPGTYSLTVNADDLNGADPDAVVTSPAVNYVITPPLIYCGQNPTDGAAMVQVPAGSFLMGSPSDLANAENDPAEAPQHSVTLDGYWIDQDDVTVAKFRAFDTATGYGFDWTDLQPPFGWVDDYPMTNVTWYDAQAYATWAGCSLPTEAQWEYAAAGPTGRNYPWGGTATAADPYNGWDQTMCANYDNSEAVGISAWPVGSFPAGMSWCGAQDMAGEVWQWCADWYGPYSATPVTNPTGPTTGDDCVLRGGSWDYDDEGYFRCAFRDNFNPVNWYYGLGFRCVSSTATSVSGLSLAASPDSPSTTGAAITLTATATGGASDVYQFLVNGVSLGDYSASNTSTWTPTDPGTYSLTANAMDLNGADPMAVVTSSAVSYVVTTPAGVPTNLSTSNPWASSFDISWSPASDNGGATLTYTVRVATDSAFTNVVWSDSLTGTSDTATGLHSNTKYYVDVNAANIAGSTSDYCAYATQDTAAGTPINLSTDTPTASGFHIAWSPAADNGGAETLTFAVIVAFDSMVPPTTRAWQDTTTGTSDTATGLKPNTTYYVWMQAYNNQGPSGLAHVQQDTAAGVPITLSVSNMTVTGFDIHWSPTLDSGDADTQTYQVRVATDSAFTNLVWSDSLTGTSDTATGLNPDTTYYVEVNASNSEGSASGWSAYVTAMTLLPEPPMLGSISPTGARVGSSDFALTVTGGNFVPTSVVQWNGAALSTTYVSATSLTATVPAADIATAGTFPVTVTTPAPGGGTTTGQPFTVFGGFPPTLVSSGAPGAYACTCPSISATGDKVAYLCNGDLYVNATDVTPYGYGGNMTAPPALSGDGNYIVCGIPGGGTSARFYRFTSTGTLNPSSSIASGYNACINEDGSVISYMDGSGHACVWSASGGTTTLDGSDTVAAGPVITGSGTIVAFLCAGTSKIYIFQGNIFGTAWDLLATVNAPGAGAADSIALSGGGNLLAWRHGATVDVWNSADSPTPTQVSPSPPSDATVAPIAWDRDNFLAYQTADTLKVWDSFSGKNLTVAVGNSGDVFQPSLDDDGGKIAFCTTKQLVTGDTNAVSDIYTATNVAPTATAASFTFTEHQTAPMTGTLTGSDPEGDTLWFIFIGGPEAQGTHGTGSIDPSTGQFTYTPDPAYDSPTDWTDSFQFQVYDFVSYSADATISITIHAVNDPPTIAPVPMADQTIYANSNTGPLAFTVSDPDNPYSGTGALVLQKNSGNLTLVPLDNIALTGPDGSGNCSVTVTPAADQTGSALITVSVYDGQYTSSTTFTLNVTAPALQVTLTPDQTVAAGAEADYTAHVKNTGALSADITVTGTGLPTGWALGKLPYGPFTLAPGATSDVAFMVTPPVGAAAGSTGALTLAASVGTTTVATATCTTTAIAPPAIVSFMATPSSITSGGSSTLAWTTTGATSVSIDNGIGAVSVSGGSVTVSPTTTTTYTLTATNSVEANTSATTTVTVVAAPTVSMYAAPTAIIAGASSNLIWNSTGSVDQIITADIGGVTIYHGTFTHAIPVTPTVTTTYTITATNSQGATATATATVTVLPAVTLTIMPGSATLCVGQTQPFTANIDGVTWSSTMNAIDAASGLYTAPYGATTTVTDTVTATVAGQTATATVTIQGGYEGDVAPRPNGDSALGLADWVQEGRFAAGLDTPQPGSEYQRANCAPRTTLDNNDVPQLTLGSGQPIGLADWVQVGRYAAHLDPLTPVGGPCALVPVITSFSASSTSVAYGGSTTLSWVTTNTDATGVIITNTTGGPFAPTGNVTINNLTATTTFALTATGLGGTVGPCSVTVTVAPAP